MKLKFRGKKVLYAFKGHEVYRAIGFDRVNGKLKFKINWLTFDMVK